ncbi:serine/threonine-protein kinase [Isosphaeraceae bacterium EP7]
MARAARRVSRESRGEAGPRQAGGNAAAMNIEVKAPRTGGGPRRTPGDDPKAGGARPVTNATAQDLPGDTLEETVAHVGPDGSAPIRKPTEVADPATHPAPPAAEPKPRVDRVRYTFTSGARPLEGYTIKRAVGRGGFGEVYYATSDSGKEVALKLITRNLDIERRGVVQCMNLKSPNLIAIYDLKTTDEGDTFVIMEYVNGPSLANVLAQYPDGMPLPDVDAWLKGLVEGVAYLHDHGIVHRDLKPANLFMEDGVVKIGDYGLAKLITGSQDGGQSESVGTCHYMAPEIASGRYHTPIDIYAIGVVLHEMLTGRVPFQGESVGEILMKHLTARPDVSALPEPYRAIAEKAMSKDPAHRQAAVMEMLGAAAPAPPEVRIIGDARRGGFRIPNPFAARQPEAPAAQPAPRPAPAQAPRPAAEQVHRIGDEEPVFYIGPDTTPPKTTMQIAAEWRESAKDRLARGRKRDRTAPIARAWANSAEARQSAARLVRRAFAAKVPPPPPAPGPLPPPRARVAELATSMIWVAPLTALLAGGLGLTAFAADFARQPQPLACLFGVSLAGAWALMAANKFWEGRKIDRLGRRAGYAVIGVGVGMAAQALADATRVGPPVVGQSIRVVTDAFGSYNMNMPESLSMGLFFALAFALCGWWKLTDRDRPKRFRVWPVVKAGLIGLILSPLWDMPSAWGVASLVVTAVVLQLSSPWDQAAARYARYLAENPTAARVA